MADYIKLAADGTIAETAPRMLVIGDKQVFNPSAKQIKAAGYLLRVDAALPLDGNYYTASYAADGKGNAVQVWTAGEQPVVEPSIAERVKALEVSTVAMAKSISTARTDIK